MAERDLGWHDTENEVGFSSLLGKAGADGIELVFQGNEKGTARDVFGFGDFFFQAVNEGILFSCIQGGVQAVTV